MGPPELTSAADRDRFLVAKNVQLCPADGPVDQYQPQARSLACSTSVSTTPNSRDTESQSVRLTASFYVQNDGQLTVR